MKIIEKKCPNCHANLEFDAGETNVKCKNCRREYMIEYDKDFVDPEVQLKAKDIQLKLLNDFEKTRRFSRGVFLAIFLITTVVIILTIFFAVNGYKEYFESQKSFEQTRLENAKRSEEFRREMEQRQAEGDEFYNSMKDEIDRQIEEQRNSNP